MILQEIIEYFPYKCLLFIHTSLSVRENSYCLLEKYLSTLKVWWAPHKPQGDLEKKIYFTSYLSEVTRQGEEREIQRYSCLSTCSFYRRTWLLNYEIRSAEKTVKNHYFGPEKYFWIMLITKSRSLLLQPHLFWNAVTSVDKLSKANADFQRKYILESSAVPQPPNGWRRILKCYLTSE